MLSCLTENTQTDLLTLLFRPGTSCRRRCCTKVSLKSLPAGTSPQTRERFWKFDDQQVVDALGKCMKMITVGSFPSLYNAHQKKQTLPPSEMWVGRNCSVLAWWNAKFTFEQKVHYGFLPSLHPHFTNEHKLKWVSSKRRRGLLKKVKCIFFSALMSLWSYVSQKNSHRFKVYR